MPKFDKYQATAASPEGNITIHPDLRPPPDSDRPSPSTLFREERIIEACDSLQVLDPRAELNQYLCEPLVPTTCPVPIWWKVRVIIQPNISSGSASHRTMLQGSPLL